MTLFPHHCALTSTSFEYLTKGLVRLRISLPLRLARSKSRSISSTSITSNSGSSISSWNRLSTSHILCTIFTTSTAKSFSNLCLCRGTNYGPGMMAVFFFKDQNSGVSCMDPSLTRVVVKRSSIPDLEWCSRLVSSPKCSSDVK